MRKWATEGKTTRRNWWDILAGDPNGNPRRVNGIAFPVVPEARRRQRRTMSVLSRRTSVAITGDSPPKKVKPRKTTEKVSTETATNVPVMTSARPKPFVKWAGGKRQLLAAIRQRVPQEYRTYHEPFLGGGAVFFGICPPRAFLSDSNQRLVRCYRGIRNDVEKVISLLKGYQRERDFFLKVRERDIDRATDDADVAAWFIFLNKTGFNGLYRVNSKNRFNVPFGDNKNAPLYDEDNLRACQRALANATIEHEDFAKVLERAEPGDLVYFDPPYVPLSATSYFTSYTVEGFTKDDQLRLIDIALQLKKRGVSILMSNSSSARTLYKKHKDSFDLRRVLASRAVNSRADRRGKIAELLIS